MEDILLSKKRIVLVLLILLAAAGIWLANLDEYLTFENIQENRAALLSFVKDHYVLSVIIYVVIVVTTAFFVPGAIALTLVGGFLFGVAMGTAYLITGATIGGTLAFVSARYALGKQMQHRYKEQLKKFNDEISRHGHNYLITLRMVPIMPFFLVNYLAGITKMPLGKFVWTTAVGMLPGSVVYTFAGKELGSIESPDDVMSLKIFLALGLLAFFTLLPVFLRLIRRFMNGRKAPKL